MKSLGVGFVAVGAAVRTNGPPIFGFPTDEVNAS